MQSTQLSTVPCCGAQFSRPLALQWLSGRASAPSVPLHLNANNARAFKGLATGRIGCLADAYVRGELEIDGDLRETVAIVAELAGDPQTQDHARLLTQLLQHLQLHWLHRPHKDAEPAHFYYDLCDELFARWLDPLRVYSCAYFENPDMTLAQAQEAELEHICRRLQLAPGQLFLDIGAGWGGLLLWAAEHHGVHGMGITHSRRQHAHVNRLIDEKGLRGRVTMRLLDPSDLPPTARFDRIASIGMFEHVADNQLDAYFGTLQRLLKPGGLLLNHGITAGSNHPHQLPIGSAADGLAGHDSSAGAPLSHVSRVAVSLSGSGLELRDAQDLHGHYARTLWTWSSALEGQLERTHELSSEVTVRAYRLYLAGCAVAFERGWISIHQLLASRPGAQASSTPLRSQPAAHTLSRRHQPAVT
jgi:cyclopropane-fatty-acyl-phospholipid synthase